MHGRLQEVSEPEEHEVRFQSIKQDNNSLVKKIFVLEEFLRDMEVANIDLAKESERRVRELEDKLELERKRSEDAVMRIQELELDNATLTEKSEELQEKLSVMTVMKVIRIMMIILMMMIMMMKMMKEEAEIKLAEYEIESEHPENFDSVKPGTEVHKYKNVK